MRRWPYLVGIGDVEIDGEREATVDDEERNHRRQSRPRRLVHDGEHGLAVHPVQRAAHVAHGVGRHEQHVAVPDVTGAVVHVHHEGMASCGLPGERGQHLVAGRPSHHGHFDWGTGGQRRIRPLDEGEHVEEEGRLGLVLAHRLRRDAMRRRRRQGDEECEKQAMEAGNHVSRRGQMILVAQKLQKSRKCAVRPSCITEACRKSVDTGSAYEVFVRLAMVRARLSPRPAMARDTVTLGTT